jgi:hypothetical protein
MLCYVLCTVRPYYVLIRPSPFKPSTSTTISTQKLMMKRNMELELEVVKALKESGAPMVGPGDVGEEEEHLRRAMEQSSKEAERGAREAGARDLGAEHESVGRKEADDEATEEQQMKEAMDMNLLDMQMREKQEQLEQAELEAAIAVSLQLEDERLRLLKLETEAAEEETLMQHEREKEKRRASEEHAAGEAERLARPPVVDSPARRAVPANVHADSPDGKMGEVAEVTPLKERAPLPRIAVDSKCAEGFSDSGVDTPPRGAMGSPMGSFTAAMESERSSKGGGGGEKEAARGGGSGGGGGESPTEKAAAVKVRREKKTKKKKERKVEVAAMMEERSSKDVMREAQREAEEKKLRALAEFRKNQREAQQRSDDMKRQQEESQASDAAIREREVYLKAQRERIVRKKMEERDAELKAYQAEKADNVAEAARQVRARTDSGQGGQGGQGGQAPAKADRGSADEQRLAMRVALARRFKADLIEKEDKRTTHKQNEAFRTLDTQLQQAEENRAQLKERTVDIVSELRRQPVRTNKKGCGARAGGAEGGSGG